MNGKVVGDLSLNPHVQLGSKWAIDALADPNAVEGPSAGSASPGWIPFRTAPVPTSTAALGLVYDDVFDSLLLRSGLVTFDYDNLSLIN